MKKKDDDAFIKSIFGTSPIKRNNKLEKSAPIIKEVVLNKKQKNTKTSTTSNVDYKKENKSFFVLERGPVNKKLKKGKIPIDKKIDFHGLSVLDAEELFINTIKKCYNGGFRCILFVTGKGIMKKNNQANIGTKLYYGKIRENFFYWITKEELQKYILSVEQASIQYGADGAFFVYLRKKN